MRMPDTSQTLIVSKAKANLHGVYSVAKRRQKEKEIMKLKDLLGEENIDCIGIL